MKSIWSEIRNNYTDENGVTHIDAWTSPDDNENGTAIALIVKNTVYYVDCRAMTDKYAQEVINEAKSRTPSQKSWLFQATDDEGENVGLLRITSSLTKEEVSELWRDMCSDDSSEGVPENTEVIESWSESASHDCEYLMDYIQLKKPDATIIVERVFVTT